MNLEIRESPFTDRHNSQQMDLAPTFFPEVVSMLKQDYVPGP